MCNMIVRELGHIKLSTVVEIQPRQKAQSEGDAAPVGTGSNSTDIDLGSFELMKTNPVGINAP